MLSALELANVISVKRHTRVAADNTGGKTFCVIIQHFLHGQIGANDNRLAGKLPGINDVVNCGNCEITAEFCSKVIQNQ